MLVLFVASEAVGRLFYEPHHFDPHNRDKWEHPDNEQPIVHAIVTQDYAMMHRRRSNALTCTRKNGFFLWCGVMGELVLFAVPTSLSHATCVL